MESVNSGREPDGVAHQLLVKQTRLVHLQIQQMLLMRWLIGWLGLLALLLFAAVLWGAARDRSLVIESFTTPPDLEAQGLSGEVLASLLLDKLNTIDAQTDSWRSHQTLSNDWAGDIKVEIPNTGLSIGQLDRGLHRWLGHQTRVSGSVYHRGEQLVLAVRGGGANGEFAGGPQVLDQLLQKAAEAVYATQPYEYSKYLEEHHRVDEAMAVARKEAITGPPEERAWGWAQVSNLLSFTDAPAARETALKAIALDPGNALAWINEAGADTLLGHDEEGLSAQRRGSQLAEAGGGELSPEGIAFGLINEGGPDELTGDFATAAAINASSKSDFLFYDYARLRPGILAYYLALNHDVAGSKAVPGALSDSELIHGIDFWDLAILPTYARSAMLEDWPAALASLDQTIAATADMGYLGEMSRQRFLEPERAVVLVRLGRGTEAAQAASGLPSDCYRCLRARGKVAAIAGDAAGADRWFAEGVKQAPSLPFAYAEWAEAKLARGDQSGGIALLRQAQGKGPHWAGPFKLEGDLLLKQGDARAAIQRYQTAAQYAPKWGALHLAWAKALEAQGRKSNAAEQYQAASALDLSAADQAVLAQRQH